MSDLGFQALIAELQNARGKSLQEVLRSFRPSENPAVTEARRRCALVRWFDEAIYRLLCNDIAGYLDLPAFIELAGVSQVAPAKWTIEASERSRLLQEWQSDLSSWRTWNGKLGQYFAAQATPEARLSAIFHFAAAGDSATLEPLFRSWYAEADECFDLAHCNALLEMLRVQENVRGVSLSALWQELREYQSARILFAGEYYKTGSYFERPDVLSHFLSILNRKQLSEPWILHIHATGGLGKTIFTRWLIARYLVPRRIPCARVDLDDFRLDHLVNSPLTLIYGLVEQWSNQPGGSALGPLLETLYRAKQIPGWLPGLMGTVQLQLKGAAIPKCVVVLDTLEEATLNAATWLKECISFLRELRGVLPGLSLVLCGRYDIAQRGDALQSGEFISHELSRFSEEEAQRYLQRRGIPAGLVRDAIVQRASSDEPLESISAAAADGKDSAGRNPFKLSMFAELAMNRGALSAEDVLRFPRADIAYLVERVIRRIDSQPLRWIIRYGAIARHLTPEFAEAVLLPPLLQALRGTDQDQPQKGLGEADADADFRDVWQPDPEAARELEEKGIAPLWEKLSAYARERGWLSWVDAEQRSELRFHPEVVNPTRELLRRQEILNELQQRAAEFFQAKAEQHELSIPPAYPAAARNWAEAIFHRFQLQGITAQSFWLDALRRTEKIHPLSAIPIATEILGREYAEAERTPYPGVSSVPLLIEAHCQAADLYLQADIADRRNWMEFRRHIEIAQAIAANNAYLAALIPPLLSTMYLAGRRETAERQEVDDVLRAAMLYAQQPRERFFLNWQLGKFLVTHGVAEAATYLRQALALLSEADRTFTKPSDIHLKLVDLYQFQGIHSAIIEAFTAARRGTRSLHRLALLLREGSYYLRVRDVAAAEKCLAESRELTKDAEAPDLRIELLQVRIAIARFDPAAALAITTRLQAASLGPKERAQLLDQEGEAHALLYRFEEALNCWNLASSSYDQARDPVGAARCALLAAALTARVIGEYGLAETHILSVLNLRGSEDIEVRAELVLLRAFAYLRMNRQPESATLVEELLGVAELPTQVGTRVLFFRLIFGFASGDELLRELVEHIEEIQPLSVRPAVLDWVADCDGTLNVPSGFVARFMAQLTRPSVEGANRSHASTVEQLILRADLYRVFGMSKEAEDELARAPEQLDLIPVFRLNAARERLGVAADYTSLFERFKQSQLSDTPLALIARIAAAGEAAKQGNLALAQQSLNEVPIQTVHLPVPWQNRLARVQAKVKLSGWYERAFKQAPVELRPATESLAAAGAVPSPYAISPQSSPGEFTTLIGGPLSAPAQAVVPSQSELPGVGARPPSAGQQVQIYVNDVPAAWRFTATSTESAVAAFLGDAPGAWQSLAASMGSVLDKKQARSQAIEVMDASGALPWELGGASFRTSRKGFNISIPAVSAGAPGTVQLLAPESGISEITSASVSGFGIDHLYRSYGIDPRILIGSADGPIRFSDGTSPIVLHITAAVRESSSGVYLDFSTSEYRAASYGRAETVIQISLTAFRLDRMLASFPFPPFVILDIGKPQNRAETVRMLFLRNLFAAQLFELGHVRGVLACGLAEPSDRYLLTSRLIADLLNEPVLNLVDGLRSEVPDFHHHLERFTDQDLEFVIPRFCAALWTNLPQERLFAV